MKNLNQNFCKAFMGLALLLCGTSVLAQTKNTANTVIPGRRWWKEAVVYQIYPRSFKDSNGDGVGDLKGIISKLDYIKSLGIDVIWLNPVFASPNADNGYDISDYRKIMKEFGTMADFDALLKGMHKRKLKLVLDLVVNHSSDEHQWFKQSRSSRNNPYRNYYHWWPAEKGKPPFRPGAFEVDGSGWRYDALTNAYYLHYFSFKQPDLNWENPKLRNEIFSMMNFWFDKGVDGFRMDVIPFIAKDTTFPVITPKMLQQKYHGDWSQYLASGPKLHSYLKEMYAKTLSKHNVMSVAEGAGVTAETAHGFVDEDRKELNMLYHFEGVSYGYEPNKFKTPIPGGYKLPGFKAIYSKWDSIFALKGWGTIYLGNHDQPRMLTRWGNDLPQFREASSKMLTTFILSMRATPYYFSGDELGMSNIKFDKIEDYRDIESINMYKQIKERGGNLKEFLEAQKISARDNGRTPFQWNGSANAGFTSGQPWLKVNPNYTTVNAAAEEKDQKSVLNYFRKMIALRKALPELVYGKYTLIDRGNEKVYAYTRVLGDKKLLVLLNFSATQAGIALPLAAGHPGAVLINNLSDLKIDANKTQNNYSLKPYQAAIVRLN
ncbi:oligo-1,6-glucosidase [Mucilaginibacter gracilis]|uniref:Oligo-1,6-glucosidase n=1 Tax=Mucilaginibacter gracilis TaxID=423350 RepID=A0A495IVM9_9SPHI|nr:alpha-glucosidase [Mucilaginibacter gracilis]RKR80780.1 oligo-1,6-glucosidase [Mucilaginibacter gracilis]